MRVLCAAEVIFLANPFLMRFFAFCFLLFAFCFLFRVTLQKLYVIAQKTLSATFREDPAIGSTGLGWR